MKLAELPLLNPQRSCLPCIQGEHISCRHYADKDGSHWEESKDGEKRIVRYARTEGGHRVRNPDGSYKEVPRRPCHCEREAHVGEPGTCDRWISGEWGHGHRCGKPVKGEITVRPHFSYGSNADLVTIEVCGIHLSAQRRREANDAKREAEWQARDERRKRGQESSQASEDWAERLATEFGIPVEAMNGDPIRVKSHPERLYAKLAEVRALLDEVYDEHPFRVQAEG